MTGPRWWEERELVESWNGVFQGGGAKGVAYVGALKAVADADCWFKAVAGASAGAITATLIAAGVGTDDLEALSVEGLKRVRKAPLWRHAAALTGADVPLYRTDELRVWLDGVLREQVSELIGTRRAADVDVTFSELYAASAIDLFIVTLDADAGVPVVLSHHNAPNAQVAWAALASSAIPMAMPKQRLVMDDGHGHWRASRMFDGGGWANYPRFVFAEPSFRAHSGLPEVDAETRTVGFALQVAGPVSSPQDRPSRFVDRPRMLYGVSAAPEPRRARSLPTAPEPRRSRNVRLWSAMLGVASLLGALSGIAQGGSSFILLALAASVVLLAVGWREVPGAFGASARAVIQFRLLRGAALFIITLLFVRAVLDLGGLEALLVVPPPEEDEAGGLQTVIAYVLGPVTPVAIALVFGVLIAVARFQHFIAHDAASVFGATLGAATRVPAWAGAGPGDHLVVVPVSPSIKTTAFEIDDSIRQSIIDNAYCAVTERIGELLPVDPHTVAPPASPVRAERTEPPPSDAALAPPAEEKMGVRDACLWGGVLVAFLGGGLGYALWVNANAGVNPRSHAYLSLAVAAAGLIVTALALWRGPKDRD